MAKSGLKRQHTGPQPGEPNKKIKHSGPELKQDTDLSTLSLKDLDTSIVHVKEWERKTMEGNSFCVNSYLLWKEMQFRLVQAQMPHAQYYLDLQEQMKDKVPAHKVKSTISFYYVLFNRLECLGRFDLRDAVGYKFACWVSAGLFRVQQHEPAIKQSFAEAGISADAIGNAIFETFTAAVRHLQQHHRAPIAGWESSFPTHTNFTTSININNSSNVNSTHSPIAWKPAPQVVAVQASPNKFVLTLPAHSPCGSPINIDIEHDDNFVVGRVKHSIQDPRILTDVRWSDVADLQPDLNNKLDEALSRLKSRYVKSKTPSGVLLVGGNGTGKTSAAMAWAVNIDATVFSISSTIKGGLQGQTENALCLVFDTARKIAEAGRNVVIVFNEFDHFMSIDQSTGANASCGQSIGGVVKEKLAQLLVAGLPLFIIAITNHPSRLDPLDIGRRFLLRFHFKLPDFQRRVQLWEKLFTTVEVDHTLCKRDAVALAARTEGHATSDLRAILDSVENSRVHEFERAERWAKADEEGVLRPARGNERVVVTGTSDELMGKYRLAHRHIGLNTIVGVLEHGGPNSGSWPKANSSNVDNMMEEWLEQANGTTRYRGMSELSM